MYRGCDSVSRRTHYLCPGRMASQECQSLCKQRDSRFSFKPRRGPGWVRKWYHIALLTKSLDLEFLADDCIEGGYWQELFDSETTDWNNQFWFHQLKLSAHPACAGADFKGGRYSVSTLLCFAWKAATDRSDECY